MLWVPAALGAPKLYLHWERDQKRNRKQSKCRKSVKKLSKLGKATKMERKGLQKGASGARRYQNGTKRKQNGTNRDQNGTKSYQHGATGCQKGAERRPKCIQKSPWAPRSILGAKKGDRIRYCLSHDGLFLIQKALKNQCKIRCRKKHEIS